MSVEGGGAPSVTEHSPCTSTEQPTPFGLQSYELAPFNEDGTPATQAGSQPFQLTTTLVAEPEQRRTRQPVALPKDLSFNLPPGLIGNPNAVAQCSEATSRRSVQETEPLPTRARWSGSRRSSRTNRSQASITKTVPVFNLVPAQGEPARFGFEVIGKIPIVIDTSVRSGSDYGVVANVKNATQTAGLLSSQVTLWGVPGDPRHNSSRGWECVAGGAFAKQVGKPCPAVQRRARAAVPDAADVVRGQPVDEPFALVDRSRLLGGTRPVRLAANMTG